MGSVLGHKARLAVKESEPSALSSVAFNGQMVQSGDAKRFHTSIPGRAHSHLSNNPPARNGRSQRQKTRDEADSEDEAIEDRFTAVKTGGKRRPLPGGGSDDSDAAPPSSSDGGFSEEEEGGASDSDGPVRVHTRKQARCCLHSTQTQPNCRSLFRM